MGWLRHIRPNLIRIDGGFGFNVDANGKEIVIGRTTELTRDTLFTNGSLSNYGIGSIAFGPTGMRIVDGDGLWQTPTITTVSQSASPSSSVSPSASGSPSASASLSVSPSASVSLSPSPSASASLSVSPSASVSPSGSASLSVSPSASASPST